MFHFSRTVSKHSFFRLVSERTQPFKAFYFVQNVFTMSYKLIVWLLLFLDHLHIFFSLWKIFCEAFLLFLFSKNTYLLICITVLILENYFKNIFCPFFLDIHFYKWLYFNTTYHAFQSIVYAYQKSNHSSWLVYLIIFTNLWHKNVF